MKKYFFPFFYTLLIILLGALFSSILYYFDIIGDKLNTIILYLISIISIFTGALMLCRKIKQKGIIGGAIYFGIWFVIINIISLIIFKSKFSFNSFIYYFILLIFSIMGGVIGKNSQIEIDTEN